MSFLDRIREANRCDPAGFRPLRIGGRRLGFVRHELAGTLRRWPAVFRVGETAVTLAPALDDPATPETERTAAVAGVLDELRAAGRLGGHWWNEPYAVNARFGEPPVLRIERAAVQPFGICGYGVHVNGYVRRVDGLHLWLGRRARDKPTAPGRLDQMVAGGQPAGLGLRENVVKECAEEAAVPESLARRARAVGTVTYCLETAAGLRPDVLFNFDLELPPDFEPVNTDGEVEAFHLWPVAQVLETVRDGTEFKFNCALVVIDFLIRHGLIDPERPDYVELVEGLRQRERGLARLPG
ncbi:MAG: DUF4743 domain-containing protein [Candidatus Competibacterales bacterium]|nr:DUF4743 domain-containing protein [Candidatus Competibacterales bacterium]